jgi:hypothetical protein
MVGTTEGASATATASGTGGSSGANAGALWAAATIACAASALSCAGSASLPVRLDPRSGRSTPGDPCTSDSLIAPSAAAAISGIVFDASANHVVLQRAQRTVRPAGPREAGSLMYEVEQLGQAISMGSKVFWISKPTSRPLMDRKPWHPPSHRMNWWNPAPRLWRRRDNLVKSAVPEGCAGRGTAFRAHPRTTTGQSFDGL